MALRNDRLRWDFMDLRLRKESDDGQVSLGHFGFRGQERRSKENTGEWEI